MGYDDTILRLTHGYSHFHPRTSMALSEGVRPRPLRHSVMRKADLWVASPLGLRNRHPSHAYAPRCTLLRHARQSPANVPALRQRTSCEGSPSRCEPVAMRWEAPCRNDGLSQNVCSSRPRTDECSYDWCNCETRESAAERTSSLSRGFQASDCPIGLGGATIVGLSKAARVELSRRGGPRPICKRSRTRGRRVLPLHSSSTDVYSQPLYIGGDSCAATTYDVSPQTSNANLPLEFEFSLESYCPVGSFYLGEIKGIEEV